MYDLSIVIPTYNEGKNIISLLDEIKKCLLDIHYQIIIHSDGRAAYYDFTDVPVGESTTPKEYYDCKAPKTASIRIASK